MLITGSFLTLLFSKLFLDHYLPWHASKKEVNVNDVVKLALTAVAGVAGTQALVIAYRKQRDAEDDQTAFTVRFGAAANLLGASHATGQLAGAYAMAALADEWEAQRQQCADVLCGYLRLPVVVPAASSSQTGDSTGVELFESRNGEYEVRRTITKIIADHVSKEARHSWSTLTLNLDRATLVDADFREAAFEGSTSFVATIFNGRTTFTNAVFNRQVDFSGSETKGAVTFDGTRFADHVSFERCH